LIVTNFGSAISFAPSLGRGGLVRPLLWSDHDAGSFGPQAATALAFLRWHGDDAARSAVYNNRARLLSEVARQAFKLRAELVERGFALILDRGGMRRVWLRGRENLHKRYLIHVAGYNLGLIMRLLTGTGTPRGSLAPVSVWLGAIMAADGGYILLLVAVAADHIAALAVSLQPDPFA
jgi:transposase